MPSGGLRVAAADGEGVADLVGYRLPSESKPSRVLARGRSERIDSVLEDPEVDQVSARRAGGLTALVVPLVFHDKPIGVISAFNKDGPDPRFTDDDLRLAEVFGTRAALAVHLSERVARETVDAILEGQEAERSRIARELHDETGSALTAILLGLTAIDQAATLPEARQASAALRETARTTLEHVGRMAFDLRPSALDDFGLGHRAQRPWARGLEEQGGPEGQLEVDLAGRRATAREGRDRALPDHTRGSDERRQARRGEDRATSAFARRERSVVLTIEDDGRGFSRAQVPGGRFGLVGMRERSASVNGALDIESKRGAGTRLTVEIPLV